jgi:hypothetical protein
MCQIVEELCSLSVVLSGKQARVARLEVYLVAIAKVSAEAIGRSTNQLRPLIGLTRLIGCGQHAPQPEDLLHQRRRSCSDAPSDLLPLILAGVMTINSSRKRLTNGFIKSQLSFY